jgi:CrcB protein
MTSLGGAVTDWILVAVGAGLGAVIRFLAERASTRRGQRWPIGTIAVNVVGAGIAGALAGALASGAFADATARTAALFVGIGVCGALTTFSGIALRVVDDAREGRWRDALGIPLTTLVLGSPLAALTFGIS